MKVSVIIPTYNGAHRISTILKSLEKQSRIPDETIIVIDGSIDKTKELIENWSSLVGLKWIYQQNKGRAGARNSGADIAKGDCIIFYDDDMQPNLDSVQRHSQAQWTDYIIGGQQIESFDQQNEFTQFKTFLSKKWVSPLNKYEPQTLNAAELFLTSANMSISKKNFQSLKGFDAHLTDAEDFDLAVRAWSAGIKTQFDPNNMAYHKSFLSFREYILRQREYRAAHNKLLDYRKNHSDFQLFKKYDIEKSGIKKIIYFFCSSRIVKLMDKQIFKFLPTKLKYAIYIRVVSALSVYYPKRSL